MLKNPDWKNRVKPNLNQGEKNMRSFIRIFSILLLAFLIMVGITGIAFQKYLLTVISLIFILYVLKTYFKLSPNLYNKLHRKKKIIPIGEHTNRDEVLSAICKTNTPYGPPVLGFYQNIIINLPAYLLKDEGYVVYFFIRNGDFVIKCKKAKKSVITLTNSLKKKRLKLFQKDLVRLFNYVINMKRQPFDNELDYIFEDVLPFKKIEELNEPV